MPPSLGQGFVDLPLKRTTSPWDLEVPQGLGLGLEKPRKFAVAVDNLSHEGLLTGGCIALLGVHIHATLPSGSILLEKGGTRQIWPTGASPTPASGLGRVLGPFPFATGLTFAGAPWQTTASASRDGG